jgi:hypothetical protein
LRHFAVNGLPAAGGAAGFSRIRFDSLRRAKRK